ncbi:hypothetical protein CEC48_05230 [Pseudomonas sp. K2I15]|nr:hypothetical protein CEC48_05230 [Pseudomonas sp. K2I15]
MIEHDLLLCTSILRLALAGRFRFWGLVSFSKAKKQVRLPTPRLLVFTSYPSLIMNTHAVIKPKAI